MFLQENLVEVFGTAVQFQRIWLFYKRQNGTYRPSMPLSALEERNSVSRHRESVIILFTEGFRIGMFLLVLETVPQSRILFCSCY
jgi:hypothetical protein